MTIGFSYRGADAPSVDPEVSAVYGELSETLARMGASIEQARRRLAEAGAVQVVTLRVGPRVQADMHRFMRKTGITNQAAAMRLLLRLGLDVAAERL